MLVGYLLFLVPPMLLGFAAHMWMKSAYGRAQKIAAPMSGYETARRLLDGADLQEVEIELVAGVLTDHYDPRHQVLRLSGAAFHGRSWAAVGIAAHEVGHALQDAQHDLRLKLRGAAVLGAGLGNQAGVACVLLGLGIGGLAQQSSEFGVILVLLGVVLLNATMVLQLVNLPAEWNASVRARRALLQHDLITPDELSRVRPVLAAATCTHAGGCVLVVLSPLSFLLRRKIQPS